MKVPSLFVPQISIASTRAGDEPMLRSISDGSCSTSDADEPGRQQRLWLRAMDSQWKLSRKDLKMKVELSRTLKSTLYQATWQGVDVVVKCAGLHDDLMAKAIRSGATGSPLGAAGAGEEEQEITDELLHEIDLLSSLRHPDLVMFLGACLDQHLPIMCVTEFLPRGDLERYYMAQRKKHDMAVWRPGVQQVLDWSAAMVRAVSFLHSHDVVHRDLKPLNLLLTKHLELKVSDFGISRMMARCDGDSGYTMTGGVGSWRYMAPEVVRHQVYDEKVDIYACGLIMYYMSSGKAPMHQLGLNPEVILQQFQQGKEPRPILADCPSKLRPLMSAAWHVDPRQRPAAEEVLESLEVLQQSKASCAPCAQM